MPTCVGPSRGVEAAATITATASAAMISGNTCVEYAAIGAPTIKEPTPTTPALGVTPNRRIAVQVVRPATSPPTSTRRIRTPTHPPIRIAGAATIGSSGS